MGCFVALPVICVCSVLKQTRRGLDSFGESQNAVGAGVVGGIFSDSGAAMGAGVVAGVFLDFVAAREQKSWVEYVQIVWLQGWRER